jgi:hypothetical protein
MGILLSLAVASILAGMLLAVNEPIRKFKKRNKFK